MRDAGGAGQRSDAVAAFAAAALLVTAMVAGGGPRGLGDALVHLVAIPALALGIIRWRHGAASGSQRLFLLWLLAVIALFAAQLLPLPASLIARLPQRAGVLADLHAAGISQTWLPMTLDRWATVRGLLAVLTFAAMWLLASTLPYATRVRLLQLAVAIAVLMSLLGFAQAAAGQYSQLRPFDYHHPVGAIGLFANRNHFASLLAMLLPGALAFAVNAQRAHHASALAWYGAVVMLLLASALSYSRAGFALTLVALAATAVALFWRRQGAPRRVVPAVVGLVAVLAVGYYAWDGLMQRLQQDPLADLRWQYLRYGWDAALAYLPWGSGLGSFPWAYAPQEPVSAMVQVFAQRAHNDPLQVLIEAGLPGAVLLIVFVALLLAAMVRKIPVGGAGRLDDHHILITTFVAVCVPLLHSWVDYPLRTLCVATVFALLSTLLMPDRQHASHAKQGAPATGAVR